MRLFYNLSDGAITLAIYERVSLSIPLQIKRGGKLSIELQFHRDGTPERLPVGRPILLGLKLTGKYDDAYLASTGTWARPGSDDGFYTATLPTNTTPINTALLTPDGDATNDKPSVLAMGEAQWWPVDGEDPDKSQTFPVQVNSAVNIGTEGVPASGDPAYPAVSAIELTAHKDASGGYAGLTLFKINLKNVLGTFTSFLTNSNTAARTYTFQDRDGTIADSADLALKANKTWLVKTTSYTASAGDKLLPDTTAAAFTITLPASPAIGDEVQIADAQGTWGTNNLTVSPNSQLMEGVTGNLVCNVSSKHKHLIFAGGSKGWVVR